VARDQPSLQGPALVALSGITSSAPAQARRIELPAALLLGLAAFLAVVGPAPLDPGNIAWLAHSDAATNYLGWSYFRSSPWMWPPAANPDYGLDIAGSVMMADANPALALPFKLLSPWLPMPFQYFGWWLLGCFLLQALFARAIAARLSDHSEQRLAITLLFLFAPCFLIRIATPAIFHMTLCGQWQILAALWLYLSPDLARRALAWTGLLVLGVLTHPYLLMMVLAIWLADLMRPLARTQSPVTIVGGAGLAVILMTVAAKFSGLIWLRSSWQFCWRTWYDVCSPETAWCAHRLRRVPNPTQSLAEWGSRSFRWPSQQIFREYSGYSGLAATKAWTATADRASACSRPICCRQLIRKAGSGCCPTCPRTRERSRALHSSASACLCWAWWRSCLCDGHGPPSRLGASMCRSSPSWWASDCLRLAPMSQSAIRSSISPGSDR